MVAAQHEHVVELLLSDGRVDGVNRVFAEQSAARSSDASHSTPSVLRWHGPDVRTPRRIKTFHQLNADAVPPPPPSPSAPASAAIAVVLDAGAPPALPPPRWSPFAILGPAPSQHWDFVGQTLFSDEGKGLGVVEGASIVYRPELSRGLPADGGIEAAGGVWPGGAWVALTTVEKDGGVSRVFRFHGDGWVEERGARRSLTDTWRIVAGPEGSAVLLRARDIGGRRQAYEPNVFQVVGSPPGAPVLRRDRVGVFPSLILRSRGDGSMAAVGQSLPDLEEPNTLILERWGPWDVKSRRTPLPDAEDGSVRDLCLMTPAEAVVVGSVNAWKVWTYDGAHWAVQAAPEGATDGACAVDGSVFAIVGDHVERRVGPDRWERIDLPDATPAFAPVDLWAGESGALWVAATGGGGKGWTLLRAPLPLPARPSGAAG
jgi:hypothetical protein